ncbi:MAG: hypothetical protein KGH75_00625 [Rhodospirillales bacterium]|nr:hypothetical protein [Rhodospirillales bacterium]
MPNYLDVSFRATRIEPALRSRCADQTRGAISMVARRDMERYYALLARTCPTFALNEACLIMDVMNGCIVTPETMQLLWANVDDAIRLDALDHKWNIDGAALVARLRALPYAECVALVDAVERAWLLEDGTPEERVRAVGLVRRDD